MSRLQVQRSEFVKAQASAVGGTFPVQPPNGPVFSGEIGISRFLPGLGAAQANLPAVQALPQPLHADVGHDLLFDQVVTQLGERPLVHADQSLGRRRGHFGNLLAHVRQELAWRIPRLPPGIPHDAAEAVLVEAMNNVAHPGRRAVHTGGDLAVGHVAARQQDDTGMPTVHRIDTLTLHPAQLLLFIGAQRAYNNCVHVEPPWGR